MNNLNLVIQNNNIKGFVEDNKNLKQTMKTERRVLRRVTNQNQFDDAYKYYKKKINKLFRSAFKYFSNWELFKTEYSKLLDEAVFIGVFTREWCDDQLLRLDKTIIKSFEASEDLKSLPQKTKDKIINKVKKLKK